MPILNMLISVPLKAPLADGSVDVTITVGVLNETGGGKETNIYHQVKFNVGPVTAYGRFFIEHLPHDDIIER